MGLNLESFITLNSAGFEKGMKGVGSSLASTVKQFAVAAIGAFAIERALSATMETAKELVNESKRMGITIEYLQVLRKAASDAGIEAETLAHAYEKVAEFRAKALGSGKDSIMVMRMTNLLGMTRADMFNSSTEDIFKKIGEKLRTTNPQEITAALKDVFGRSFGPIVPLLSRDLDSLRVQMEKMGMIMSSKVAVQLYQLDTQLSSVKMILMNALAPVIVQVVESFLNLISSGNYLSQAFEGLVFSLQQWGLLKNNKADLASKALAVFNEQRKSIPNDPLTMSLIRRNAGLGPNDKVSQGMINNAAAEAAVSHFKDSGLFSGFSGQYGDKDFAKQFSAFLNSVQGEASGAVVDAAKGSKDVISGIRKWVEDFKNGKIEGPPKPNFESVVGLNANYKSRVPSDDLVKVGNFLASSRPALNTVQNLLVKHSAQTASNTEQAAAYLKMIYAQSNVRRAFAMSSVQGEFQKGLWPAN